MFFITASMPHQKYVGLAVNRAETVCVSKLSVHILVPPLVTVCFLLSFFHRMLQPSGQLRDQNIQREHSRTDL